MPGRAARAGPDISILVELDLTGVADPEWQRKLDEVFGLRVEPVESVIVCPANPHHTVGSNIEGVGNLVEIIGQRVSRPLLALGIELGEHTRAEPRNPNHSIRCNMKTSWPPERRIPFSDVTVGGFRINTPDAVPVEFGIPNHAIDR